MITHLATFLPVLTWPMSTKRSSDADARSLPSWEKDRVRTGQSSLEKVWRQASSLTSHKDTRASALPTAKYEPVGSNSMQMQFPGWACP